MSQKKYIAYEDIEKFSPVFAFYCPKTNKNYVYISQEMSAIDDGTPFCIGVCYNSVKRGDLAQIITNGQTKVRYYGKVPDLKTSVYLVKTFNNFHMRGVCSSYGPNMVPFLNNDNSIIRLGTVSNNVFDKKDYEEKLKYLNIYLDIQSEQRDKQKEQINSLLTLPKENIMEKPFSFYDIGKDLDSAFKIEIVQEKYNLLCNAFNSNPNLKEYCYLIDQYCRTVFQNIPDPSPIGFVKQMTVFNTAGQLLYDSYNSIGIYNYKSNDVFRITLIPNIYRVNNFPVCDSLKYSVYFPFINIDDINNQGFMESLFSYSSSAYKEIYCAYQNGIGTNVRYSPIDESFEYIICFKLPISKNSKESDSLIFRLTWKKK